MFSVFIVIWIMHSRKKKSVFRRIYGGKPIPLVIPSFLCLHIIWCGSSLKIMIMMMINKSKLWKIMMIKRLKWWKIMMMKKDGQKIKMIKYLASSPSSTRNTRRWQDTCAIKIIQKRYITDRAWNKNVTWLFRGPQGLMQKRNMTNREPQQKCNVTSRGPDTKK